MLLRGPELLFTGPKLLSKGLNMLSTDPRGHPGFFVLGDMTRDIRQERFSMYKLLYLKVLKSAQ